jgi:hypothetical protein
MTPILANVGVPMIFPQVVLMAFALVPVVLIESAFVRKPMGIPIHRVFLDVGLANVCTTILGVPLAWGVMLGLHMLTTGGYALGMDTPAQMLAAVTLQAAWLIPYEDQLFWMIPAAATVLLIPCFLVSVLIERWVLVRRWRNHERRAVFSAVLRANVWSYLFLFIAGSLWLVLSVR